MANQKIETTRLQLYFVSHIDNDGNDVLKMKSFNNMSPSATAPQLLATSIALASLQQYPLKEVRRNDISIIS